MGFVTRGIKNAFRNIIRTFSITIILALSVSLALVMLLSYKAVQNRITSVKANIGNVITVSPAGARGFEGGGEPLTEADVATINKLPNISKTSETLVDRLTPTTDTSLASAIDPGSLGGRAGRGFGGNFGNRTFSVPIQITGTADLTNVAGLNSSQLNIKSGTVFDPSQDTLVALVGQDLASKNNLTVGSSFKAYNTDLKVAAIFDAGNRFANAGLVLPLKTVQRLSGQIDQVSTIRVEVASIADLSSSVSAIKDKLGSKADVVSQQDSSNQALAPLESIKNVALFSLLGALVAGSVIIFLTMLMIVRERRREIGVLKAIGAPNNKIVLQFISEAISLTIFGGVIGLVAGVFFSNPLLQILLNSAQPDQNQAAQGVRGFARFAAPTVQVATRQIQTLVGWDLLVYAALAVVVIAIVGSAVPAFLISKISPAEVLRSE